MNFDPPLDAQNPLQQELASGERLLWSGRPAQGLRLRASDIYMVPFSLLWGGFAIFWEYSVLTAAVTAGPEKGVPIIFPLWGVPFVLIGLYMIFGRFFVDSYLRARTWYGVTDRRVILLGGLFSRQVQSLALQGLNDVSLKERADGSGSISFGPSNPMAAMWPGMSWPGMSRRLAPSFEGIEQARKVYDLIRQAQQEDRAAGR